MMFFFTSFVFSRMPSAYDEIRVVGSPSFIARHKAGKGDNENEFRNSFAEDSSPKRAATADREGVIYSL
jgi:hypothetical protein